MKDLLVWSRLGDNAKYQSHDNPHTAGLELRHVVDRTDIRFREDGIVTGAYKGRNYISLYWGDEDAQWFAEFNESDKLDFIAGIS